MAIEENLSEEKNENSASDFDNYCKLRPKQNTIVDVPDSPKSPWPVEISEEDILTLMKGESVLIPERYLKGRMFIISNCPPLKIFLKGRAEE